MQIKTILQRTLLLWIILIIIIMNVGFFNLDTFRENILTLLYYEAILFVSLFFKISIYLFIYLFIIYLIYEKKLLKYNFLYTLLFILIFYYGIYFLSPIDERIDGFIRAVFIIVICSGIIDYLFKKWIYEKK